MCGLQYSSETDDSHIITDYEINKKKTHQVLRATQLNNSLFQHTAFRWKIYTSHSRLNEYACLGEKYIHLIIDSMNTLAFVSESVYDSRATYHDISNISYISETDCSFSNIRRNTPATIKIIEAV